MVELIVKIEGDDGEPVGELVRCLDCKWYKNYYCTNWNCPIGREPDWFCADGERKEVMKDDSD